MNSPTPKESLVPAITDDKDTERFSELLFGQLLQQAAEELFTENNPNRLDLLRELWAGRLMGWWQQKANLFQQAEAEGQTNPPEGWPPKSTYSLGGSSISVTRKQLRLSEPTRTNPVATDLTIEWISLNDRGTFNGMILEERGILHPVKGCKITGKVRSDSTKQQAETVYTFSIDQGGIETVSRSDFNAFVQSGRRDVKEIVFGDNAHSFDHDWQP